MNLWLRLLCYLLRHGFEPTQDTLNPSHWPFRVWMTDMDVNGHMNNGRFLELMDLGRLDFFWRSKLRHTMFDLRSVPILGGVLIRYRLPLSINQCIALETRLLGFEEQWMVIEQRFVFTEGEKEGAVAAIALCKCGFYDRKAGKLLDPREIFKRYDLPVPEGELPESAHTWRTADLALKEAAAR